MKSPFNLIHGKQFKSALMLAGLCTVMLGAISPSVNAAPQLIAQQTNARTPQTTTGRLDQNSSIFDEEDKYYETHTFEGTAGEVLAIELVSDDFNTLMGLSDPNSAPIASDDDRSGGANAQIVITLPETGTYTIIVTTYTVGETGNYQLTWRAATAMDQALAQAKQLSQQAIHLQQSGQYAEAIPLAEQALKIRESQMGPEHPLTVASLNNLAELYRLMGRYSEAEPLFQRALVIREAQLGPDHPDMVISISGLASLYFSIGRYSEAEPLFQNALTLSELHLGPDHPYTAASLNNLAGLYRSQGRYSEAEPLYQRALAISETQLGPNHPSTIENLVNLAILYFSQGRYSEAEPLYQRALAISETQLGPNHPSTALSLNTLALLYKETGRYSEAEPLYQRALAIRESQLGAEHPSTALSLNNLAGLYFSMGRYNEAEPLLRQALAINESQLGPDHPDTASSLNNLAELYSLIGRYSEADQLHQRALAITESQLGPDHPDTASSLSNLAGLYFSLGRYNEAEPLLRRALAISESQFGSEHPETALGLNNLAELYRLMGRYSEAESLYKRALTIAEEELGPNHPNTAKSLNNLALLYKQIGRYSEATSLLQRTLNIQEVQLGFDHPDTFSSLNNLAELYSLIGRYSEADQLHQRALAITESQLGPEHPNTALSLNNLASLYHSMGRYSEAELLYQRALTIFKKQQGPEHPNIAASLNNLAFLYWAQGQFQPTLDYLKLGLTIEETVLNRNLVVGSDADKRKYLETVSGSTDAATSFSLNTLPDDPTAARLALTTLIQRKGRILDLFTNLRAQLVDTPTAVTIFDELTAVDSQISNLTFNPTPELASEAYQSQLKVLREKSSDLENQLSQHSLEFANLTASPSAENIQSALPSETALVEFIRYQPIDPKAPQLEQFGDYRYAAYILTHEGTIKGVDLGASELIDAAISTFTSSLASPGTPIFQVKEEAQVLDSLVMAPVRQALGNTTTVFLSPDGALNLVPFEALVDENNNYLVEHYQFRYLTSGRDLMRVANTPASNNPAVLMGGPTFSRAGETIRESVEVAQRAIDFENNVFPSLEGTETEIQEIAKRLNVDPYLRTTATEAQLKAIDSPSILHVATHGFFKPIEDNTSNPLLQSGLLLAGVTERQSGPEQDGILTALEVTGMNLQGTQLAILSACETGLGELAVGEGVYGLRRALVLAGTQSQVISLWKVDDTATQELMINYYDRLLAGAPRDAALRDTQLAFLDHEEYSHPYYWSAFIGSGDWRPLD